MKYVTSKSVFVVVGATGLFSSSSSSVSAVKLAELVLAANNLNSLIIEFCHNDGRGNVAALVTSKNYYMQLSMQLYNLRQPSNSVFESFRTSLTTSLQNLMLSVKFYTDLITARNQLSLLQGILENADQLKQYIEDMSRSMKTTTLFPETHVEIIPAEIEPQIVEYIRLYGIPVDGIFDPDKLAFCSETLLP